MKTIVAVTFLCLAFTTSQLYAQDNMLEGAIVGVGVSHIGGSTGVTSGVRYWDEYVGAELAFGFDTIKVEVSSVDAKRTDLNIGLALLAGRQYGNFKPYFKLGIEHSFTDNEITVTDTTETDIVPSIGVDILAAEHLVLGLTLFSYYHVLDGDISNVGFDGHVFAVLPGFSLGYLF